MGVDIIWLMPIHPIGEKNKKGGLGSYYSVKDFRGVNPEFGNMQDFKNLVKKIHEMGMYVIIDWVGNHSAWDNSLATNIQIGTLKIETEISNQHLGMIGMM
jgi:cyclomaltodextrinase